MIPFLISLAIAAAVRAQPVDRKYEGDWYISDQTNNNTGEREVYAFQTYIKSGISEYVTLTMRCSGGKPLFFVDWDDVAFPDQTVLTIAPIKSPNVEISEEHYVFQKSGDIIERGLRASPETSAKVVSALGQAKYAKVTAHISSGPRAVTMNVDGTLRAWDRVSRHCPVQIMARPPL